MSERIEQVDPLPSEVIAARFAVLDALGIELDNQRLLDQGLLRLQIEPVVTIEQWIQEQGEAAATTALPAAMAWVLSELADALVARGGGQVLSALLEELRARASGQVDPATHSCGPF